MYKFCDFCGHEFEEDETVYTCPKHRGVKACKFCAQDEFCTVLIDADKYCANELRAEDICDEMEEGIW